MTGHIDPGMAVIVAFIVAVSVGGSVLVGVPALAVVMLALAAGIVAVHHVTRDAA